MKNQFVRTFLSFILILQFATVAQGRGKGHQSIVKKARKNDVASEYVLDHRGQLFRTVKGRQCKVADGVTHMKVSQHPEDTAVLYFERDHDLYVLHNTRAWWFGCPRTSQKLILKNVKKFNVVGSIHTKIVNVALSKAGQFHAWDNHVTKMTVNGVQEYRMNQGYGVKGKPFSSYVSFLYGEQGKIFKLKGKMIKESKWEPKKRYRSLKDFLKQHGIQ